MKRKQKSLSSKAVVPISGGMDSSVLLHLAASRYDKVITVNYDYGQKHRDKEINCASFQIESVDMPIDSLHIKLPFFKDICQVSSLLNNKVAVAVTTRDIPYPNRLIIRSGDDDSPAGITANSVDLVRVPCARAE